jgi:hypothetical protein
MNSFAMLASTTAISAYVLDCFPGHAALASSWVNFWRVVGMHSCLHFSGPGRSLTILSGGFVITYFNIKWAGHSGPAVAFGCQGAIVFAAFGSIIVVQLYGHKWRVKYPAPAAEN